MTGLRAPLRVVITGAGSGFGRALALRMRARGDDVVGVDAEASGLPSLVAAGIRCVHADVRDEGAMVAMADGVLADGPVDVVVNDAGFAVFGTQAEADLHAVRAMFETNVLGAARVTRLFLPALRGTRGAVVQISSVAGRVVLAESGFYAASKHALEALSEALSFENRAFGLRVIVVEPGAFATGFSARARRLSRPRDPASPYADVHGLWDGVRADVLVSDQDPAWVVDAVLTALDDPSPFQRVGVGADAGALLRQRAELGDVGWMASWGDRYDPDRAR